ncbi:MAG: hypothetical protein LUE63_03165, partial [Lachnospiraceae bacterium]|nr:hypothetical protein [Lachnospiraceae bacterium]
TLPHPADPPPAQRPYPATPTTASAPPPVRGSALALPPVFPMRMLIVDLLYAFIDPRIKAQYSSGGRKRKKVKEAVQGE